MSETPWTPGPWECQKLDGEYGRTTIFASLVEAQGGRLWVGSAGSSSDARLIASAPEMAELLEKWVTCNDDEDADGYMRCHDEARALLSRIKGGEV